MKNMMKDMVKKLKEQEGATMVEYAIMVALIAIVVMASVGPVGAAAAGMFDTIAAAL